VQSGYLRFYAASLLVGVAVVGLLLPPPVVTLHLSILLWLPPSPASRPPAARARHRPRARRAGRRRRAGLAILYVVDFDAAARGLQYVTDETWIAELGIHYKLGLDGLNLFLVLLAAALWLAVSLWAAFDEPREREGLFFFHLLVGETAVLGASWPRTSGCSSRSSTSCSSRSSS
jgi:NADH-quinone oxidoreductase subunit M